MQQHITDHAIANAVRMKRSLFVGVFLIVEGVGDKRIYGLVIDHEACKIEVAYGRDNVLGAISILNSGSFSGVLGIVDADADRLAAEIPLQENVFWTDLHDLECMILNSRAFDRVLDEFGTEERIAKFTEKRSPLVARELAVSAVPVGCLRLLSIRDGLALKFEGITFSRFVKTPEIQIDVSKLVREVTNNSQKHHLNQQEIAGAVVHAMQQNHDPWQISCGHDIVELLSLALRKTFCAESSGEVAPERLERSLRLAYSAADLRNTRLFRAVRQWEENHPDYPVLVAG
jgi:hypothetical protein